jgi:hypothetical protein
MLMNNKDGKFEHKFNKNWDSIDHNRDEKEGNKSQRL